MNHRKVYFLNGNGLEIGALHQPSFIPDNCSIEYLDIKSYQEMSALFPEVNNIVKNKYIGNINNESIFDITNIKFDFIIANHVIEHLPNPIQAIRNICEGLKQKGVLVISVPDKRNSYDANRELTFYEHILADYYLGTKNNNDDNVIEVLFNTNPDCFKSKQDFLINFNSLKSRNEHVHVWTSETFEEHLRNIFQLLNLNMKLLYQSKCEDNGFEYFGVFEML